MKNYHIVCSIPVNNTSAVYAGDYNNAHKVAEFLLEMYSTNKSVEIVNMRLGQANKPHQLLLYLVSNYFEADSVYILEVLLDVEELSDENKETNFELVAAMLKTLNNNNQLIVRLTEKKPNIINKLTTAQILRIGNADQLIVPERTYLEYIQDLAATTMNDSTFGQLAKKAKISSPPSNLPNYEIISKQESKKDVLVFSDLDDDMGLPYVLELAKLLQQSSCATMIRIVFKVDQEQPINANKNLLLIFHALYPNASDIIAQKLNEQPNLSLNEFTTWLRTEIDFEQRSLPIRVSINVAIDKEMRDIIADCAFAFSPNKAGFSLSNTFINAMIQNQIVVISHQAGLASNLFFEPDSGHYQRVLLASAAEFENYAQFALEHILKLQNKDAYLRQQELQFIIYQMQLSPQAMSACYDGIAYKCYPDVNSVFWYHEDWMSTIISACAKNKFLLSETNDSHACNMLLTKDNNIYQLNDSSYSIANVQVVGQAGSGTAMLLDNLFRTIDAAVNANIEITERTIVFALNISNMHWCLVALNFVVKDKKICEHINLTYYDSVPLISEKQSEDFYSLIFTRLNKYLADDKDTKVNIKISCPRKQPDANACGPITVENMWELILTGKIVVSSPYAAAELLDLRNKHLLLLNSKQLTNEQKTNAAPSKNSAKDEIVNTDEEKHTKFALAHENNFELHDLILCYLINELQDELNNCGHAAQENLLVVQLEYLKNKKNGTQRELKTAIDETDEETKIFNQASLLISSRVALKEWLISNQKQLVEYDLFNDLFQPTEKERFHWAENGLHNLATLALRFFKVPLTLKNKQLSIVPEEKSIDQSSYSSEENDDYFYKGQIGDNGLPNGRGEENLSEACNFYLGNFLDGKRIYDGMEEYVFKNLKATTYFRGHRSKHSEFMSGNILCKVGSGFYLNKQLIDIFFEGKIENQKIHGLGEFTAYHQHDKLSISIILRLENGIVSQIFNSPTEQNSLLFQEIYNYAMNNLDNFSLYPNQETEQQIASIRQSYMEKSLKKPNGPLTFSKGSKLVDYMQNIELLEEKLKLLEAKLSETKNDQSGNKSLLMD